MGNQFKSVSLIGGVMKSAETYTALPEPDANIVYPNLGVFHKTSDPEISPQKQSEALGHYNEGYKAGKLEAEHVHAATTMVMQQALDQLKSTLPEIREALELTYSRAIASCLNHLLPSMSETILRKQIAETLLQASQDSFSGNLNVQLHPNNQPAKDFLLREGDTSVQLREDASQSETAVNFSWGSSAISLDPIATAQACLTLFNAVPEQYTAQAISSPQVTNPEK